MPPRTTPEPLAVAGIEIRHLGATGLDLEQRAGGKSNGDLPHIVGYASVFDSPTTIGGGGMGAFREIVRPGAFTRTIAEGDVRALFNHNPDHVLGRSIAGTLALIEDRHGLKMDITPPDTTFGRDVVKMVERGDVTGASFGFIPVRQRWAPSNDAEPPTRELLEVELVDVSAVTYPAYSDAEVSSRAVAWARRGLLGGELTEEEVVAVRALLHGRQALQRAGDGAPAVKTHDLPGLPRGHDAYAVRLRQLEAIEAALAPPTPDATTTP